MKTSDAIPSWTGQNSILSSWLFIFCNLYFYDFISNFFTCCFTYYLSYLGIFQSNNLKPLKQQQIGFVCEWTREYFNINSGHSSWLKIAEIPEDSNNFCCISRIFASLSRIFVHGFVYCYVQGIFVFVLSQIYH